jgi:hypothetical protein
MQSNALFGRIEMDSPVRFSIAKRCQPAKTTDETIRKTSLSTECQQTARVCSSRRKRMTVKHNVIMSFEIIKRNKQIKSVSDDALGALDSTSRSV